MIHKYYVTKGLDTFTQYYAKCMKIKIEHGKYIDTGPQQYQILMVDKNIPYPLPDSVLD